MSEAIKIWDDAEFPLLNKGVDVNDFVINKTGLTIDGVGIVPCSVGVVRAINEDCVDVCFIGKNKVGRVKTDELIVIDVARTGKEKGTATKPFKFKICNICHVLKNQKEEFDCNQNDKQGRQTTRPSCKDCRVGIDGKKLKSSEKKRMLAIKPQPHELFECPICKKLSIPDVTANIVIDHDHRTGNAREWICDSCNTGIGRFQDDPKMLEKISEYIRSYLK